MDQYLIERMKDTFNFKKAFWNFFQVFTLGYFTIAGLLLTLIANEENWQAAFDYIDAASITSPLLLFFPLTIGLIVAFFRGHIAPEFDVNNPVQIEAYIESRKFTHWPIWQKILLLIAIGIVILLPLMPDRAISQRSYSILNKEATAVSSETLNRKLQNIEADGIILQSEFNEFMSLSLKIQAQRYTEKENIKNTLKIETEL